jgi:hypothetical protein
MAPGAPVVLIARRRRAAVFLTVIAACVTVGALLVLRGEPFGWWTMLLLLGVPLFGASLRRPDLVTLDGTGFGVRPTFGASWTRSWRDVGEFFGAPARRGNAFVIFEERAGTPAAPRAAILGRKPDGGGSGFSAQDFDLLPNEIAALLNRWREAYGSAQPSEAPAPAFATDGKGRLSVIDATGQRTFHDPVAGHRVAAVRRISGEGAAIALLDRGRYVALVRGDGHLVWTMPCEPADDPYRAVGDPTDGTVLLLQHDDRRTVRDIRTGQVVPEPRPA